MRRALAHLLFFALAISATAFGACELAMMRAQSPAVYAATLRWAHVPLAMVVHSRRTIEEVLADVRT